MPKCKQARGPRPAGLLVRNGLETKPDNFGRDVARPVDDAADVDSIRLEDDELFDDEAANARTHIRSSASALWVKRDQIECAIETFDNPVRGSRIVGRYVRPQVEHVLMRKRPQPSYGHFACAVHADADVPLI